MLCQVLSRVMSTEKLAEGIRNFAADQDKLEKLIANQYDAARIDD